MRKQAAAGVALVLGLFSSLALAAPGEYWEITNKMEMQGMSMPGMTSKVCIAKGGEKDPRNSSDKDCEVTDVKNSGNHTSWKMRCNKNGDVMTASGDMSATPDRTEGTISLSSAKTGNMTMSFVNKRVGGACDSDEMKKKVEAQMAANNREQAKACDGAKSDREWLNISPMILGKGAACADKKDQFCEIMRRDSGHDVDLYFTLKQGHASVSKECGLNMDAARKSICKSVDAGNADFRKQLGSGMGSMYKQQLRAECPAEMKTYAEVSRKRYCEGRDFTAKQQMSLAACLKGGSSGEDEAMNTPDPEEPPMPASSSKKSATKSGKGDAAQAEPGQEDSGSATKLPGGISIPGLPSGTNISPDAVIEGAKKLKNLFGF
jgi:hypothetical protein